jgi:acetylglutamate kinase
VKSEKSLKNIIVIKLGGSTLGNHDTALEDLVTLQQRGMLPVVVHGGGNTVTDWLGQLGISTMFVRGLRVTDAETLKVVIAILAGLVNKELVATIEASGGKAIGLSGIDGGLLEAKVKDVEMGYVGEIVKVNPAPIIAILKAGFIPIIAPLSLQSSHELGENGFMLNVNGDTVAGELAAVLGAERLIFLTDVAGVCNSSGELIHRLSPKEAKAMLASETASGGMIPKIEACLNALSTVTITRIIDGRVPHALIEEIEARGKGTTIA